MEIFLIRHTSLHQVQGLCYGQSEVAPGEQYEAEKAILLRKLASLSPTAIGYTSPLQRCQQLAQALPLATLRIDDRLKEMHFGEWELKAWNDIDPSVLGPWMEDFVNVATPGGECFQDLSGRAVAFWRELTEQAHPQVAVVTHAGVIRSLLCHVLEIPLRKAFTLRIDYGSVSKITLRAGLATVDFVNG